MRYPVASIHCETASPAHSSLDTVTLPDGRKMKGMRQHCGRVVVAAALGHLGPRGEPAQRRTSRAPGSGIPILTPMSRSPAEPPPPAGGRLKEPYASAYKKLNQRKADADDKRANL